MVGRTLEPLLAELRVSSRENLCRLLDFSTHELDARLTGEQQFSIPELMAIARWMRRPISTVLAPLDGLLGKCA